MAVPGTTVIKGLWNQVNPYDDGRTYADAGKEQDFNKTYSNLGSTGINTGAAYITNKQYEQGTFKDTLVKNPDNTYAWVNSNNIGPGQTPVTGSSGTQVLSSNTTAAPAPTDPYAQWGGVENFQRLQTGFNSDLNSIRSDANSAANSFGTGLNSNILDWIDNTNYQQGMLDRRFAKNEATRIQGGRNVMDMVGQGVRSGGVMLNQKNAADSSAAGAIAQAYGQLGSKGMGDVQNQYLNQRGDLQEAQEGFNLQSEQSRRRFDSSIDQAVENITRDARQQLAILEAAQIDADMPTRIDIEIEKQAIKDATLAALAKYDKMVADASFSAASPEDTMAQGYGMANAGLAENALQFSATPPQAQQGAGLPSELPIFTYNRDKREV